MAGVVIIGLTLAAFWFFVVMPQQRKVRAHQATVARATVGDEVMTTAGLMGTIVDLDEDTAWIELAPGVVVQSARLAIGEALASGTVRPSGRAGRATEAKRHDPTVGPGQADEESGGA